MTNVGIDTGGTSTRIWDGERGIIKKDTPKDYEEYIIFLQHELQQFEPIKNLVISLPGVIENNIVLKVPNLSESWKNKNLAEDIKKNIAITGEVKIIQDTQAAGVAVQHEEMKDMSPTLLLTLSTGVGGALVTKDFVFPLEIGHMPLNLSGEDRACSCTQIGCAEADLSGTSIYKVTGIKAEELEDKAFWQQYGKELGKFLLFLTTEFVLKQILLTGGVSEKKDEFLDEAVSYMSTYLRNMPVPKIALSSLGDSSGAEGAYHLAAKLSA